MPICPHCQQNKQANGLYNHVKMCAKYPGHERMREIWERSPYLSHVARALHIHTSVVGIFLKRAGIERDGRAWNKKARKIYPQLVRAKSAKSCGTRHKPKCPLFFTCRESVARGGLVRCEAPDEDDLRLAHG